MSLTGLYQILSSHALRHWIAVQTVCLY